MSSRRTPRRNWQRGQTQNGTGSTPSREMFYITDGSASNRYELTTTLFPGAASMTIGFVFRDTTPALTGSPQFYICSKYLSNNYGYRINHAFPSSTFDRFIAYMTASPPGNVNVIRDSGQLWDGVKWHTCVVRLHLNLCTIWIDGVQIGVATGVSGFTPASGNNLFQLYGPTGAASTSQYAAIVYAETALSDLEIPAWHAQVSASNNFDFPGNVATEVFDAADSDATWLGKKAYSPAVPLVGTVTKASVINPVFA